MKNYDDLRHGSKWKEIKGIKKTGRRDTGAGSRSSWT